MENDALFIRKLDNALWLKNLLGCCKDKRFLDEQYESAIEFGKNAAIKYPFSGESAFKFLFNNGVKKVSKFSETKDCRFYYHAYYEETRAEIAYDETFANDIYPLSSTLFPWSKEDIIDALLLHECFHHLEVTKLGLTTEALSIKKPSAKDGVWRDIAAFSFVREQKSGLFCQVLDCCWLKVHGKSVSKKLNPSIWEMIEARKSLK